MTPQRIVTILRQGVLPAYSIQHGKTVEYPTGSPSAALATALCQSIPDDGKEHLVAVALDAHMKPLCWGHIATGSVDNVPLYPRDIYSWALTVPSVRFVGVAHNHPSGDVTPSSPDKSGTVIIARVGKELGIDLAWSLVVTHESEAWAEIPIERKRKLQGGEDGENGDAKAQGEDPESEDAGTDSESEPEESESDSNEDADPGDGNEDSDEESGNEQEEGNERYTGNVDSGKGSATTEELKGAIAKLLKKG